MKKFLKKIKRSNLFKFRTIVLNFVEDFRLYLKHSNVFRVDNLNKKEAKLILDYHALEKGMLFQDMKAGFGKDRLIRLHQYLKDADVMKNISRTQIRVAFQVMCKYYELHKEKNLDISKIFSDDQYAAYKKLLNTDYKVDFQGVIAYNKSTFYHNNDKSFDVFASSRKSIRNFTGEKVDKSSINKAVELALTSPSVCNRQASRVYLIENKEKIDKILDIQGGFRGYSNKVHQLLIVTNDRNYYYTVGERNQFYIDGGIFLMNLLYSLHFYKIANCPANWGKTIEYESKLDQVIKIPKSEKIICMVPIGIAVDEFRVTLSKRRNLEEVLYLLD